MLGIYENRKFVKDEKIWLGRYKNLTNVLHWHREHEIIRIYKGSAKIKIGNFIFNAVKNDCFFCSGKELHYIIGEPYSQIDIMIIDKNIGSDITDKYSLISPKLNNAVSIDTTILLARNELDKKGFLYREILENEVKVGHFLKIY